MIPEHLLNSKIITNKEWEEYQKLKEENKDLWQRINKTKDYVDKLLYFGIRNEEIDLREILLYLIKKDYKDITLRNLDSWDTGEDLIPCNYEELEKIVRAELEREDKENKL